MSDNELTPKKTRFNELHLQLQDLLAGYADDELTAQEIDVVEAHLIGCAACRADLERQQIMSRQLHQLGVATMSVALDKQIDEALKIQANKDASAKNKLSHFFKRMWEICTRIGSAKQTGWVMTVVMLMIFVLPNIKPNSVSNIPMIKDAVGDYHRVENSDLPMLPVDNKTTMPLTISGSQLLAIWTTEIGGEPAQAFAVKVGHSVIIQYRISQNVLYRNPSVRKAVSTTGDFRAEQDQLEILALPINEEGLLIVGPRNAMSGTKEFLMKDERNSVVNL